MIIVSVDLHSARTGEKKTLGRMVIGNTGGTAKRGEYRVAVGNKRDVNEIGKVWNEPAREGSVKDYPRLSYNVWRLVLRSLKSAFPEEN